MHHAGASAGLTSGQVATLDVLVKEMLGRSDRPFAVADILQRCSEKKLALSEAAVTQARPSASPSHSLSQPPPSFLSPSLTHTRSQN